MLRLGRQEFEFGSGRFVDVREGPNVRQAFDGASLEWKTPSWTVDGLATKPVLNGTGILDAPPNHGSTFWGVYAVHPLNEIRGGNIDLYYLGLARKNAPFERGSQNELRHTVGGRYWDGRNCKAPTTLKDAQGCRGFEFRRSRGSLADAILRAFYVQGRRRRRATSR